MEQLSSVRGKEAKEQNDMEESLTMDIMMLLDTDKVPALREEFEKKEEGLTEAEFVYVMMKFINSNVEEIELVSNLCELFAHIDVNGDGTMEWDEFTSYIVETGNVARENEPNNIQDYHLRDWEDENKHVGSLEHIYYFPHIDKLAVVEKNSNSLSFYNPENMTPEKSLKHRRGDIGCATHMASRNQIGICASDLSVSLYDDQNYRLMNSFYTETSQTCLEWSPKMKILFTGGLNGAIHGWNPDSGEDQITLGGMSTHGYLQKGSHRDMILDMLQIESLESIASASMDRTIKLWDIETGKHKKTLEGHMKGVRSLAYNVDYRFMVSAGFDYDALVWNPYVEHLILRLHGHNAPLCKVEMIPDTPQIVTADVSGTLKIWDIRNFGCMQTLSLENTEYINDFASVHHYKSIVTAGRRMDVFDYEKLVNPQLTDDLPLFSSLFNPTTMTFITASGRDIKLWDARHGTLIKRFRGFSEESQLSSLCLDDRERKFIIGLHDGSIIVCDYMNGSEMKRFAYPDTAHASEVSSLIYCNEFKLVISAGWDDAIIVHDEMESDEGVLLRKMSGGHDGCDITALAYSFPLSLIASGSACEKSPIVLWDFEFARVEAVLDHFQEFNRNSGSITSLCFVSKDFPGLVSADSNGGVAFWCVRPSPTKTNTCVTKWNHKINRQNSSVLVITADEERCILYTGDEKGYISKWDYSELNAILGAESGEYKRVDCENPRRNIRVDVRNQNQGRSRDSSKSFFMTSRGDNYSTFTKSQKSCMNIGASVNNLDSWKAHSDSIQSIQLLVDGDHECIITSSYDCLAKIFTLDGQVLGTLRQGENFTGLHWKFKVDAAKRKSRLFGKAVDVMDEIDLVKTDFDRLLLEDGDDDQISSTGDFEDFVFFNKVNDTSTSSYKRKTPKLKPINAALAGRGLSNSLKGRNFRSVHGKK